MLQSYVRATFLRFYGATLQSYEGQARRAWYEAWRRMAVFLAIPIIGAVQAAIAGLGLMPASSKSPAIIGAALGSFGAALVIVWRIGSPLETAVGEARRHAGQRDLAQLTLFRAGCIAVGLLFCVYLFYAGRAARGSEGAP